MAQKIPDPKFCTLCGAALEDRTPEFDHRVRQGLVPGVTTEIEPSCCVMQPPQQLRDRCQRGVGLAPVRIGRYRNLALDEHEALASVLVFVFAIQVGGDGEGLAGITHAVAEIPEYFGPWGTLGPVAALSFFFVFTFGALAHGLQHYRAGLPWAGVLANRVAGERHAGMLREALRRRAFEFKDTPMVGRTHGVHAEPITFGLKLANWYAEVSRDLARLERAAEEMRVGKFSGAVGNSAHLDPALEERICRRLGLEPAPISSQVIQRDRHAHYLCTLAVIASTLDKIAVEIRHLQRTEVREVEEFFSPRQKGSSAMPHKRNPITCEQISGLARMVRAHAQAALENVALWHERDISHSSVERVIIPDSTILVDYMLHRLTGILSGLQVYPERMKENMGRSYGLYNSQNVLLNLTEKGMTREDAYAVVQKNAMLSWKTRKEFKSLLLKDKEVGKYLTEKELNGIFDLKHYFGNIDYIFKRVFGKA